MTTNSDVNFRLRRLEDRIQRFSLSSSLKDTDWLKRQVEKVQGMRSEFEKQQQVAILDEDFGDVIAGADLNDLRLLAYRILERTEGISPRF